MGKDFDVIVVGGGLAGSSAAYTLAKEGLDVLIIERGSYAGSKNMTGGRIYTHCFTDFMPDFADTAPLERKVARECLSFVAEDGAATTIEFQSPSLTRPGSDSYVVLRSRFDRWLFEQAENQGAVSATDMRVDCLIVESGMVKGVRCADDEVRSDIVVLADGINSSLAAQVGVGASFKSTQAAVGLKGVFELGKQTISDRAHAVADDEGAAWLFAGSITGGMFGGGFCYTNEVSASLGLVIGLDHIGESAKSVVTLFDEFCEHPAVAPLIKGGTLVEYSAHVLSEAGIGAMGSLCGNGVLVTGDAAGLCLNTGYMVRGMDFAITSGHLAAKAVISAQTNEDFSESSLACYEKLLSGSYVLKELRHYQNAPQVLEKATGITGAYPQMLSDIFEDMYVVDSAERKPLSHTVRHAVRKVGLARIVGDMKRGMKYL